MQQLKDLIAAVKCAADMGCKAFTRDTVNKLVRHIEAIEEEKELLLQQIERTLEEQRADLPSLPLEVAEAIIACVAAGIPNYSIISLCNITGRLFRNYDRATINALDTIKQYKSSSAECEEKLFRALVLGYTIEQTLQQRINEGVAQLARVWIHEVKVVNEASTIEFASKVARFIQEVHAE